MLLFIMYDFIFGGNLEVDMIRYSHLKHNVIYFNVALVVLYVVPSNLPHN